MLNFVVGTLAGTAATVAVLAVFGVHQQRKARYEFNRIVDKITEAMMAATDPDHVHYCKRPPEHDGICFCKCGAVKPKRDALGTGWTFR